MEPRYIRFGRKISINLRNVTYTEMTEDGVLVVNFGAGEALRLFRKTDPDAFGRLAEEFGY